MVNENLEMQLSMEADRGAIVEERSCRLLVLGDWSGGRAAAATLSDERLRQPIEIDRDNFDEVMARFAPTVTLSVADQQLTLRFGSIDDFNPDQIFEAAEIFSQFRNTRRRLASPDTFAAAARELGVSFSLPPDEERDDVSQTAAERPETRPPGENLLDEVIARSGGSDQERPGGDLARLIADLVRPHLSGVDVNEQARLIAAVDASAGELMREILHGREFKTLEAAWRGLFFLVRRAETSPRLKIFAADISHDALADDLKSSDRLAETAVYKLIAGDDAGDGWSAVIGNYAFGANVDDAAALIRIAKICAAADVPFVSHVRPEFFDDAGDADGQTRSFAGNSEASVAAKLWRAIRETPESRYLGICIPRFFGRMPYGAAGETPENLNFEEFNSPPRGADFLWINPCFAVGLLFAESFAAGENDPPKTVVSEIERLPIYVDRRAGSAAIAVPLLERQLTEREAAAAAEAGLMTLIQLRGSDRIRLIDFRSVNISDRKLAGRLLADLRIENRS